MMSEAIDWLRYIVLLKWPYSSEFYLFSLVTSGCVKARGGKPRCVSEPSQGRANPLLLVAAVAGSAGSFCIPRPKSKVLWLSTPLCL